MVNRNKVGMIVLGMYAPNKFGNPSTANGFYYPVEECVDEDGRLYFTISRDVCKAIVFERDIDAILFNEKYQEAGFISKPMKLIDVRR